MEIETALELAFYVAMLLYLLGAVVTGPLVFNSLSMDSPFTLPEHRKKHVALKTAAAMMFWPLVGAALAVFGIWALVSEVWAFVEDGIEGHRKRTAKPEKA